MALHPVIAIDASSYAVRAVVVDEENRLLDSFEGKPDQTRSLLLFLNNVQKQYNGFTIVASPLDSWPKELEKEIRRAGFSIRWLSPDLMRGTIRTLAPWNKKRRLHRASLLAYIGNADPSGDYCDARELTLYWEAHTARNTIDQVNCEIYSCSNKDSAG